MQAIEMGAARIDQQAYLVRFGGTDATTSPSSGTDLRTVRYGSMSDRARPDTIPGHPPPIRQHSPDGLLAGAVPGFAQQDPLGEVGVGLALPPGLAIQVRVPAGATQQWRSCLRPYALPMHYRCSLSR